MADNNFDSTMGRLISLGSVGMEMVVPIAIGVFLDNRYECSPWATMAGAILGLVGGLLHMMSMLRDTDDGSSSEPPRDKS